jgi:ATP-dependent phosphoenolpyruvate carboxykinase
MSSGGKYVLRKHIRFVHSKRIIQHEVHGTITEMVEVADEMFNRTMAIAMFRHQRTPVVPLRTYHVSPLYVGL